ncbi:alpha/beta fold hydrolase [Nocardiopsis suaedae]|uniref:Alpha/beta fold hydrolase n=1 Tax=Nocardiopsis suaedae TaxID=3018444 RepID=A0ABT4THZ8_9ACTN|nr:alpha/beta fold hydrolase [Nocardiopsis suaedae]MDA2804035.1 alpha/beta fold hydrolase [Nocardiopsis suaedae]
MPAEIPARAAREMAALLGGRPEALDALDAVAPRAADAMAAGFADVLSESGLGRAEREIATLAALIALGDSGPQLAVHTAAARNAGVDDSEIALLVHHLVPYVGFPRVLQAVGAMGLARVAPEHEVGLGACTTRVTDRPADGAEQREPLVLLHALALDRRMWSRVLDLLPADRRVIACDLRGHGRAADAPPPATLHDHAGDLAALLDRLEVPVAQVAGLSLGGAVAQTFALDHPDRVARLDLLATVADPKDAFEGRARSGEADGMAAQIAPTLARWFTPETLAENPWAVRYARDRIARTAPADWAANLRALAAVDTRPRLPEITVPTRVVAGGADRSTPADEVRTIADDIPGAEYSVIPGAPHMMALQKPDELAAVLAR